MIDIDLMNNKAIMQGDRDIIESEMLFMISAYYKQCAKTQNKSYSVNEILKQIEQKLGYAMNFMEVYAKNQQINIS